MTLQNAQTLALSKGKSAVVAGLCLLVLGCFSTPMVPNPVPEARDLLHGAARRVTPPKHRAPVLLASVDQPDIRPEHRTLADKVLRILPPHCKENLRNFYVNYDPKNTSRGLGGATTVIVTGLVPDKEFMALVIHECGHITDLGGLFGSSQAGVSEFYDGPTPIYNDDPSVEFYRVSWASPQTKKKGVKSSDFVSGYAATDAFEDFAESFAYFALQRADFERLAKKNPALKAKYDFLASSVFPGTSPVSDGKYKRISEVPWDTTKLPW